MFILQILMVDNLGGVMLKDKCFGVVEYIL